MSALEMPIQPLIYHFDVNKNGKHTEIKEMVKHKTLSCSIQILAAYFSGDVVLAVGVPRDSRQ